MENVLFLFTLLSLVAFVVGMLNPKTVKCKSRGTVALFFGSLFFVFLFILGSISETPPKSEAAYSETLSEDSIDVQIDYSKITVTQNTPKENAETESSIGKPIQIGHFVYTIQSVSFRKRIGDEWFGETADGIYMIVNLSIKNISKETRTLDNSLFSVTDKNGIEYEYSTDASTALEMSGKKTLFLKQCQPNITTNGFLVFEVPEKGQYYLHLLGNFWGTKSVCVLLK